jgi:hypothetical protein
MADGMDGLMDVELNSPGLESWLRDDSDQLFVDATLTK